VGKHVYLTYKAIFSQLSTVFKKVLSQR
jgi:hypothetical protein